MTNPLWWLVDKVRQLLCRDHHFMQRRNKEGEMRAVCWKCFYETKGWR